MGTEAAGLPDRVGRYEIVLPIAKGGMATVYLARASGVGGFDRYMALKLTAAHLRSDPDFAAHLIEEAKLVAHLRHNNVVPVYDVGECEHGVFLVMEYVPGDSFSGLRNLARAAGGELPTRVALRALVDGLLGLHAAHEQADEDGNPLHLVHRDFSPQNILVGTDGIARLTDFGIAKASSRASTTGAGLIKGKLRYVAPEQARGEPLDRRCDIWAAGVIAWEVLARQQLVHVDGGNAVAIPKQDPPRVRSVAPDVPESLDEVVARALRVDRAERLATAQALAKDLTAAARAAGLFADAEEVAEHVNRLAGPVLAERKALLAQARRQRRNSAPDVRTMIGIGPAAAPMRAPLPSLPEVPITPLSLPAVPAAAGSELGIEVDLGGDVERASEGLLGPATSMPPGMEDDSSPAVFKSPVALPRSPVRRALDAAIERARELTAPPWTKKKMAIAAGGGGALLFLLLVIVVSAVSGDGDRTPRSAAAATAATETAAAVTATTAVTAETPETAPSETATAAPQVPAGPALRPAGIDRSPMLHINADAPIQKVVIGTRSVDAEVAAPALSVDLDEEELGKTLRVAVTSTDGRVVVATAEEDSRELEVSFAGAAAPRPVVHTPPPPQEKRTWPKRTVR